MSNKPASRKKHTVEGTVSAVKKTKKVSTGKVGDSGNLFSSLRKIGNKKAK